MKDVQDRIVQFSNRYKLTNVETGEVLGTFDFDEVTGTVQQVGTEIDAELFDSIANDLAKRVRVDAKQNFTSTQQKQARENIDAAGTSGNYPNLGAGYLANGTTIRSGSSGASWHKFMQVSNLYTSNSYSAILLVNGVLHTNDDTHSNSEHSGIIEIDYYNTSNTGATYYAVNVLAGNLTPEDFCLTVSGNSISIYKKLKQYQIVQFVQFSVIENGADTVYMDELQSSAPEGAVYAVVRNNASQAEMANSVAAIQLTDEDLNDLYTSAYWGKIFFATGGNTVLNKPNNVEWFSLEIYRVASGACVQRLTSGKNSSADTIAPTVYQRYNYNYTADGWYDWEEIVTSTGTYSNLTAGYAQSIPTASETVIGGAKMWVDGGKLYIKTE